MTNDDETPPSPIALRPELERPRERLCRGGGESLSLRELIALILGTGPRGKGCLGLAAEILGRAGSGLAPWEEERTFFMAMENAPLGSLQNIRGLGAAGVARLGAAFELARRYNLFQASRSAHIHAAPASLTTLQRRALARIGAEWRNAAQEWLGFVPVFKGGRAGAFCLVERGVRTHVNVDAQELFLRILSLRPEAICLAHNHPSGSAEPSAEDQELTRATAHLLRAFGIGFIGHFVVTSFGVQEVPAVKSR